MIQVVAALIYKENKVLLAKRSKGDRNVYGKWEFPGGKVEPGESEEQAIEREIKEEFEIEIRAKKFLMNQFFEYPTKTINLKLYDCDYIRGQFQLHDHSEYVWANPETLEDYDLAPADRSLAQYVKEKYRK